MSCIIERQTRDQHAFSRADSFPVPPFFTLDASLTLKTFSIKGSHESLNYLQHPQESSVSHRRQKTPEERDNFWKKIENLLVFLQNLNKKLLRFDEFSISKNITLNSTSSIVKFEESSRVSDMDLHIINVDTGAPNTGDTCDICRRKSRNFDKSSLKSLKKIDFLNEENLCETCATVISDKWNSSEKIMSEDRMNEKNIPKSFLSSVCVAVNLIANFLAVISLNKKSEKLKRNIENAAPLARLSVFFTVMFIFHILPLTSADKPLGNPYEILGVKKHAALQDIRKAYKNLVKEW